MDLEEISKQYNVTLDELKKVDTDLRKKYDSIKKTISLDAYEKYVENGITQHVNKFKSLGLQQFFGVILTLSQPRNGIVKRRAAAMKKYSDDPDIAVSHGYVQEFKGGMVRFLSKGVIQTKPITSDKIPKNAMYLSDQKVYVVPLDERENWQNGKKNFGYLKPLPSEQWFVNIEGLASEDGNIWKPFKMVFNCGEHVNSPNITIPQSKLIKFLAKIKENNQKSLILSYNDKYTKFERIEGDISILNEQIMNFYDNILLSEIQSVYADRKTNFDTYAIFGQVQNKWKKEPTEEKPHPWCSVVINDGAGVETIKILLHPDVSAEFEEQSLVKVWGSLSEGNKWDPDLRQPTTEKEITMFGTGVYTFSSIETPLETPTEETDDGWET